MRVPSYRSQQMAIVFLVGAFSLCLWSSPSSAKQIPVNRYASVGTKPTKAQVNPFLAIAQFKFRANVNAVGEAIAMVLQPTGYTLVEKSALSKEVRETLTMPLPIPDRELGPMAIKEALVILMGKEVFDMVIDPVHRRINFHLKSTIALALNIKQKGRVTHVK